MTVAAPKLARGTRDLVPGKLARGTRNRMAPVVDPPIDPTLDDEDTIVVDPADLHEPAFHDDALGPVDDVDLAAVGIKDPDKVVAFIAAAREAGARVANG